MKDYELLIRFATTPPRRVTVCATGLRDAIRQCWLKVDRSEHRRVIGFTPTSFTDCQHDPTV